jgi:hypothetical protein
VNLSWADNSTNETGFQVERSIDNATFTTITTIAANSTSYSDAGRTASTTYYYRVRATGGTPSGYSNTATVTTLASSPPAETWQHTDVGSVGIAGSDDAGGTTITVRGSGADIWGTADGFRFLYRVLNGDCTVEAQVSSMSNTHPWAKAGVMIRESLAANARNVFALATQAYGIGAQVRPTPGAETTFTPGPYGAAIPYWVRLVRTGSTIVASTSANGTTWTTLGTYNVAMTAQVYVGFAVTSHNNAALNTATFSDPFIE